MHRTSRVDLDGIGCKLIPQTISMSHLEMVVDPKACITVRDPSGIKKRNQASWKKQWLRNRLTQPKSGLAIWNKQPFDVLGLKEIFPVEVKSRNYLNQEKREDPIQIPQMGGLQRRLPIEMPNTSPDQNFGSRGSHRETPRVKFLRFTPSDIHLPLSVIDLNCIKLLTANF